MLADAGSSDRFIEIVLWIAVLIVLLVALWVVWMVFRKWYFAAAERSTLPWSLQDLRRLQESGQINAEEFERLRQQVIGSYQDNDHDEQVDSA
jgi:uncharacterized membrane protein